MKPSYKIWVEGKADQKFIADVLKGWFGLEFNKKFQSELPDKIVVIEDLGGKGSINKPETHNLFKDNTKKGGTNILIFDADKISVERRTIEEAKTKYQSQFEYFLLPDNQNDGELEDLLEQIINPDNAMIFDCWKQYENCIEQFNNPQNPNKKLTIPAKKSKIYSYLEVLVGETNSEKEKVKDANRDFLNESHWSLDPTEKSVLLPLANFFIMTLQQIPNK